MSMADSPDGKAGDIIENWKYYNLAIKLIINCNPIKLGQRCRYR